MIARGTLGPHDAELERVEGERAFLSCAAPLAPGQPAVLVLVTEPVLSIQLKTVGSRRREDGRFSVEARIVMLRRHEREQLDALRSAR